MQWLFRSQDGFGFGLYLKWVWMERVCNENIPLIEGLTKSWVLLKGLCMASRAGGFKFRKHVQEFWADKYSFITF